MIVVSGVATDGFEGGDGGGIDLSGLLTPGVVIAGLVALVVLVLLAALLVWVVARRLRRSPTVSSAFLAMKGMTADPATQRVTKMRLELQRALSATERSLAAAREADQPLGELPAIVATLHRAGGLLDQQLRLAEVDPDPQWRQSAVDDLAPQVHQLIATATGVRRSTTRTSAAIASSSLDPLQGDLATEAAALQTWTETYARLGGS